MKRRTVLSVALAAAVATGLVAGPGLGSANASDPGVALPEFSATPDGSVAGTVTGSLTSAATSVYVRLAGTSAYTKATPGSGTFDYAFATWGFGPGTTVEAVACPGEDFDADACSATQTSAGFTPTDVTPGVTWFTDSTIGPGQDATITTTDTGGGVLHATFTGSTTVDTPLNANAETTLNLGDGAGTVTITRCADATTAHCSSQGFSEQFSQPIEVRTTLTADVSGGSAITQANPQSAFTVSVGHPGTYELSWHLEYQDPPFGPGGAVVGSGGTIGPDAPLTEAGTLSLPVGATLADNGTVPDGTYTLVGTIDVVDPAFGTYADVPLEEATVRIDTTGPEFTSLSTSAEPIYPNIGTTRRPSSVTFHVDGGDIPSDVHAEVRADVGGALVATPAVTWVAPDDVTVVWNGRTNAGTVVGAGLYRVYLIDSDDNRTELAPPIHVSTQRLINKPAFVRTITPKASFTGLRGDRYVGRCSFLRQPSKRGWVGSYGYYANTRCLTQTWAASAVSTVHQVRLPIAESYTDMRVDVYGGSARAVPGSRGVVRYLNAAGTRWFNERLINSRLIWHPGATRSTNGMITSQRYLRWGFATALGHRYDVGKFRVVVHYKVLSAP